MQPPEGGRAQLSFPGWAGSRSVPCHTGDCPPAPGASCLPRLLAQAGQLGPRGVEVTLGALGPAAQLAARFLEHLGADSSASRNSSRSRAASVLARSSSAA